jgi:hypothetical protein
MRTGGAGCGARTALSGVAISEHKFRVGQTVKFFPDPGVDRASRGHYTIVRLPPLEGSTPQYRVKSSADGHERITRETKLGPR